MSGAILALNSEVVLVTFSWEKATKNTHVNSFKFRSDLVALSSI